MPVHDPRLEAEKKRREEKIAASRASASPIQQRPPMQAQGGMGPSRPSPLAQAGIGIGKKLLGSALGPLGGVLGGLFNEGGNVTAKKRTVFVPDPSSPFGVKQTSEVYNDTTGKLAPKRAREQQAAQVDTYEGIAAAIAADKAAGRPVDYNKLAALQNARANQNRAAQDATRQAYLKKNPEFRFPGGSQGVIKRNMGGPISMYGYNKGGKAADKRPWWQRMLDRNPTRRAGMNVGGMVPQGPLNPNGYNEGGPVAPTPIKKVMDEDKIEIQRETFERAEARKDMKFQLDEKRAAEKHAMDMKLKKATAVTKKAPLAKK